MLTQPWIKHEDDILPSDDDFNFSKMRNFPSHEYNSWRQSERRYNNGHGYGRGEPMPTYNIEKINMNDIKYMAFTFYNNGSFNHKSLIITRKENKLIDNSTRLKLCKLMNILSVKKECMDYRYARKMLLQQFVTQQKNKNNDNDNDEWICINCWNTRNWRDWNNSLQRYIKKTNCPKCGVTKISVEDFENKYLFENNDNKYDDKEFDFYKQRIQDIIDPLLNSDKYWIPSIFNYNRDNKEYAIKPNTINNLSYHSHSNNQQIYDILGKIFTKIVPMFEWVLNKKINGIYDELKVAISIQEYQLKPMETYFGGVHREGYKEENIVAAAVYYFDFSDERVIGDDIFKISASLDGVCGGGDYQRIEHELKIRQGYILVFNNDNINHSLKKLENIHQKLNLHRKIVVFMLVNPDKCEQVNDEYNINKYDECELLVNGYYTNCELIQEFPNEIIKMVIGYIVDNIKELREIRNRLRMERSLPSKSTLDLRSYGTPWIGVMN